MPETSFDLFEQVRNHAFQHLTWEQRSRTNLYLDERVYDQGQIVGPPHQRIVAERPSIIVFADHEPRANFSHSCSYLFYDLQSRDFYAEVPAHFPPISEAGPSTLRPIHEPVKFIESSLFRIRWPFRCPVIVPDGRRYAVLFSGMSNKRHLNDMEFLYRTLVDIYQFDPNDIFALTYSGSLDTQDGVQTHWPGDGTPYRIRINGQGTRNDLDGVLDQIKNKIQPSDLLLIHTNNHGGYDGQPGTSYLCTYPNWAPYYANDFATKLAQLTMFRKLIVMMEQCHAGGFNAPIIAQSPAAATSVSSAALEPNSSYVSADGNWDPFARDWIAAQAGHDPFGLSLAFNPDADGDGKIEASEAHHYADSIKLPSDTPIFTQSSVDGGAISLGREYRIWFWWCFIWREALYKDYIKLPPEEYAARLRQIQPKISELASSLDETSVELKRRYQGEIEALTSQEFER